MGFPTKLEACCDFFFVTMNRELEKHDIVYGKGNVSDGNGNHEEVNHFLIKPPKMV